MSWMAYLFMKPIKKLHNFNIFLFLSNYGNKMTANQRIIMYF